MDSRRHPRSGGGEIQADGRIRKWSWVEEKRAFLRVILLEDGETVHNAFFDRRYPRKERE